MNGKNVALLGLLAALVLAPAASDARICGPNGKSICINNPHNSTVIGPNKVYFTNRYGKTTVRTRPRAR